MLKTKAIILLICITLSTICGCSGANENRFFGGNASLPPSEQVYSISGRVISSELLQPLANIEVSIATTSAKQHSPKVFTNAQGYYKIDTLTPGEYKIEYFRPGSGYAAQYRDITISSSSMQLEDIKMASSLLNRCYGGNKNEMTWKAIETKDGCIAIAGNTSSDSGGDIPERKGITSNLDIWVIKIDPKQTDHNKSILFNRCYGGNKDDYAYAIVETSDGCLAIAGETNSPTGEDIPARRGIGKNDKDLWLLKIDTSQTEYDKSIVFNQCYGGNAYDIPNAIITTKDSCIAIAGETSSPAGSDIPDREGRGTDNSDIWLLKIDTSQTDHDKSIVFNQCYGGGTSEIVHGVTETNDGRLTIVGTTSSNSGGDIPDRKGRGTDNSDIWLLKINTSQKDHDKSIVFNQCYGGDSGEMSYSITETNEGFVAIAGTTSSNSGGDIPDRKGRVTDSIDIWLLKIDTSKTEHDKSIVFNQCYGGDGWDVPYDITKTHEGFIAIAGVTNSLPGGDIPQRKDTETIKNDIWILKIDTSQTEHDKSIVFNQCYGGDGNDTSSSITKTADGCLLVTGYTLSNSGGDIPDRKGRTNDDEDIWLLKINDNGQYKL